jgi:hypothetical protein
MVKALNKKCSIRVSRKKLERWLEGQRQPEAG